MDIRLAVRLELPSTSKSLPGCSLSLDISSRTLALMSRVLFQSGSGRSSVREITIFDVLFILDATCGSSSIAAGVGQYPAIPDRSPAQTGDSRWHRAAR